MSLKKHKKDKNKHNINSRKYGQVKLRHSKRGVYSCLFAILVFLIQIGLVITAFVTRGQAPHIIGSIGWISVICGGIGIYYGIRGFREREKNYITCKIGMIANAVVCVQYLLLFIRGLF